MSRRTLALIAVLALACSSAPHTFITGTVEAVSYATSQAGSGFGMAFSPKGGAAPTTTTVHIPERVGIVVRLPDGTRRVFEGGLDEAVGRAYLAGISSGDTIRVEVGRVLGAEYVAAIAKVIP